MYFYYAKLGKHFKINYKLDCKKAELQRLDAFKLWCWKILLGVPWTARRSKLNLREIKPECSLGRMGAEAETPVFWCPDANSRHIGKAPDSGKY